MQYRIGTVTVTNGSNIITGSGTLWQSNISVGDWFIGADKIKYNVSSVDSDTQIQISVVYGGATASGSTYVIHRDFIDGKPIMQEGDIETVVIFNSWVASSASTSDLTTVEDTIPYGMTQAEFDGIAEANKRKFAGSGNVNFGKSRLSTTSYDDIGNGLYTAINVPDLMLMAPSSDVANSGDSITDYPVINCDGVLIDLITNPSASNRTRIELPPTPTGLDKKDGTGVFADLAAAIAAGGTALNASVLDRKDLVGLEVWYEALETNGIVCVYGLPQYGASTWNGITLSQGNVAQGYSAFGEWDSTTQGYTLAWTNALSDETKAAFINDKRNNIYRDATTGQLIQVRARVRSIKGLGDSWENIYSPTGSGFIRYDNTFVLRVRGASTDSSDNSYQAVSNNRMGFAGSENTYATLPKDFGAFAPAKFSGGDTNTEYYAHEGKCFFLPIALVSHRNQGAYHDVLNPNGANYFQGTADASFRFPYYHVDAVKAKNVSECFTLKSTTDYAIGDAVSAAGQARPDGKFYDAIYAGDVEDLRIDARRYAKSDILSKAKEQSKANELRGVETNPLWEVASVTEELLVTTGSTPRFTTLVTGEFSVGDFVVVKNGDNSAYGYVATSAANSVELAVTKVLAVANDTTGATFARTQGATTTIYRLKEGLQFNEMLQCDVIGDPANYYSGQTYTNTGATQTVDLVTDDVILLNDATPVGGTTGHYYRYLGAGTTGTDISVLDYSNASNWTDLGPTYDGQTWTNDGTSQTVTVVTGDIVYNNGSSVTGTIGHYYRRVGADVTADLSLGEYATIANWADLGRKYRGQQWTNFNTAQTVLLSIGDVVFAGPVSNGEPNHFYKSKVASSQDIRYSDYTNEAQWTDLGPDWNESAAAGSWLQDGIPGFPNLTNVNNGSDLIPDGTSKSYLMSRKVKDVSLVLSSDDNGATWTVSGNPNWTDLEGSSNARTVTLASGSLWVFFYKTDADFTEEADNSVVDALGEAYQSQSHQLQYGAGLVASLTGKVPTSANAGQRFGSKTMNSFAIGDDVLIGTYDLDHDSFGFPAPSVVGGPAAKTLFYLSHENGMYYLNYLFAELGWDTTKDDANTFTNITGADATAKTAGEYYHVTDGNHVGYWLCKTTVSTALNSSTFARRGDDIINSNGDVFFTAWDGTGWGDDKTFTVVDGTGVKTDLNGNVRLVGTARTKLNILTGLDN